MYTDDFGLQTRYGIGANGESALELGLAAANMKSQLKTLAIEINGDELETTSKRIGKGFLPKDAVVVRVLPVVLVAGATGTATITIGTQELDGTVVDEDGLVAGATVTRGVKSAGAQVNVLLDKDCYISAKCSSVAGVKGTKGLVVVEYI